MPKDHPPKDPSSKEQAPKEQPIREQALKDVSQAPVTARTVIEAMPSHRGEISALASAQAPFIYFDGAPNFGIHNGIVNVTLEAIRFSAVEYEIIPDRVIVAHLRMGMAAAQALKAALEKVLLLAAPAVNEQKN